MKHFDKPKAKYTRKVLFAGAVVCALMLLPVPAHAQSGGDGGGGAGFGNNDQNPEPVGQTSPKEEIKIIALFPGATRARIGEVLLDASKTSQSTRIRLIIPGLTTEQTKIISRRLRDRETLTYMRQIVEFALGGDLNDQRRKERFRVLINDRIANAENEARILRRHAERLRMVDQTLQAIEAARLLVIANGSYQATADALKELLKTLD